MGVFKTECYLAKPFYVSSMIWFSDIREFDARWITLSHENTTMISNGDSD